MTDQVQTLEQKVQAQEKTIRILSERLEQHIADDISGFALFEQNIALEHAVEMRTQELELALEELKAAQTELLHSQKLQAIGQLASGIAHEINTPTQYVGNNISFLAESFTDLMTAIQSCEDLVSTPSQEQSVEKCLNTITSALEEADFEFLREEIPRALGESEKGIKRVAGIVTAMKDFAHPSGGTMQPVDLRSIIQTTAEISRNEWKLVADLETQFDPQLPEVEGLKDELGQALLNLIVNAAHAIEDHKKEADIKGVIRITTRQDGEWAEIQIEDNGCGIPEETLPKIFDPFFTTKEVGRGSGQGLAIAYNVVTDKHNGRLDVSSESNKGTVFTIRLPLENPDKETPSADA
jgi:signal transduction histidine kinase